jgi:hypothetical protein
MSISINGSTGISGVDGDATTPALQGGDTNTGISFGTDEVRINTGGTQRAVVDASGRLGVGTSSPQASLQIGDSGSGDGVPTFRLHRGASADYFQIDCTSGYTTFNTVGGGSYNIAMGGTNAVTIDYLKRVGIGTASPTQQLQVSANALINSNGAGGGGVFVGVPGYAGAFTYKSSGDAELSPRSGYALTFASAPGGTERARIDSSGRLLVATSTSQGSYNLQCYGTGVWGQGAYVNGSDASLKENVQDLESALDVVKALRPVTFQYKSEYSQDTSTQSGFIAQELQQAMQGKQYLDGIVKPGTNHLNVAYQGIIAVLVKAVQELEAEVQALKGGN